MEQTERERERNEITVQENARKRRKKEERKNSEKQTLDKVPNPILIGSVRKIQLEKCFTRKRNRMRTVGDEDEENIDKSKVKFVLSSIFFIFFLNLYLVYFDHLNTRTLRLCFQ